MAVNTTDIKTALLACTGAVTTFPFSFKILEDSDLKVYWIETDGTRNLLGLPTNYSVSAVNDDFSGGGNVETIETYEDGFILIVRDTTNTQESDYTHGDDLPADMLENDFDRRCMVGQEHVEKLGRAIVFPVEDETTLDPELPPKADRLAKFLYFDATNGEPTMVDAIAPSDAPVTDFMKTLLDDDDADEVITTLIAGAVDSPTTIRKWLTSIKAVASADYVILDDDGYTVINVTTGAADRTITLPTAAQNTGRALKIRKVDDGAGYVIVDGEGAETINGTTTWQLFNQYDYVVIECDGTEWFKIGGTEPELVTFLTSNVGQADAVAGTWYGVTGFTLALPTGGTWDIEYQTCVISDTVTTNVEATVADGTAEEDDDLYTVREQVVAVGNSLHTTKAFRRTFASNVTLHVNMRTTDAGTPNITMVSVVGHLYIRAKRIR